MALEIEISTGDSKAKLDELAKGLDTVKRSAEGVAPATDKAEQSLERFGNVVQEAGAKAQRAKVQIQSGGDMFAPLSGSSAQIEARLRDINNSVTSVSGSMSAGSGVSSAFASAWNMLAGAGSNLLNVLGGIASGIGSLMANLFRFNSGAYETAAVTRSGARAFNEHGQAALRAAGSLNVLTGASGGAFSSLARLVGIGPVLGTLAIGIAALAAPLAMFTNAFSVAGDRFESMFSNRVSGAAQRLANTLNSIDWGGTFARLGEAAGYAASWIIDRLVIPSVQAISDLIKVIDRAGQALGAWAPPAAQAQQSTQGFSNEVMTLADRAARFGGGTMPGLNDVVSKYGQHATNAASATNAWAKAMERLPVHARDRVWEGGQRLTEGGPGYVKSPGIGPHGGGSGSYHDFTDNMSGMSLASSLSQAYGRGDDARIRELGGIERGMFGKSGSLPGFDEAASVMKQLRGTITELDTTIERATTVQTQTTQQLQQAVTGLVTETLGDSDLVRGLDQLTGATLEGRAGMGLLQDSVTEARRTFDQSGDELGSAMQELKSATLEDITATYRDVYSQDANTNALQDTTQALQDTTQSLNTLDLGGGGSSDNYTEGGGGGGGGQDAYDQDNLQGGGGGYFDVGGVVGSWGGRKGAMLPAAAWSGAPHFADGGLTDGGIPIVAHPNEAVIPLQGGAVPVSLGGSISRGLSSIAQATKDVRESVINVGTLAHNDFLQLYNCCKLIESGLGQVRVAISSISVASHASGGGGLPSNSGGHEPVYGYNGSAAGGSGVGMIRRGYWGTAATLQQDGSWLQDNYYGRSSMYQSGPQFYDASGKLVPVAGVGADGITNTSRFPGMSEDGAPFLLHPDEAVIPLKGGAVPVTLRGNAGGGGGHTIVNQYNTVALKADHQRSVSLQQFNQQAWQQLQKAVRTLGSREPWEDPTIRNTESGSKSKKGFQS